MHGTAMKRMLCVQKRCLFSGMKWVNRDVLRDLRFPGVVGEKFQACENGNLYVGV
jgi:hypothetical protein